MESCELRRSSVADMANPIWVTVVTAVVTAIFGAGGGAAVLKAWLTYKTRGLELQSEDGRSAAALADTIYLRLEESFRAQLDVAREQIAKHEERITQLEQELHGERRDNQRLLEQQQETQSLLRETQELRSLASEASDGENA